MLKTDREIELGIQADAKNAERVEAAHAGIDLTARPPRMAHKAWLKTFSRRCAYKFWQLGHRTNPLCAKTPFMSRCEYRNCPLVHWEKP